MSCFSRAAIISFVDVDIPIATTAAGTSVNLETGASANTDDLPGADVNFYFGGTVIGNDADSSLVIPTFQPVRLNTGNTDTIDNLDLGTPVHGSSTFSTGFGGSSDHIGTEFTAGSPGYIGFSLETGSGTVYGWILTTLNPNTSEGTIHSWAYDDTGAALNTGTIPEPTNALLSLLALLGLTLRRQR